MKINKQIQNQFPIRVRGSLSVEVVLYSKGSSIKYVRTEGEGGLGRCVRIAYTEGCGIRAAA